LKLWPAPCHTTPHFRFLHEHLPVVRVRPALAGDVRGTSQLRRVAWSVDRVQPCDQLLVAVAAFGQWPAPALRDLSLWAINRFGRMGWLALSERKQEWLPKAATVPGGAGHSWVQRTCGRYSQAIGVAFRQSPVLLRDTGGYIRVRRLSRGFSWRCRLFQDCRRRHWRPTLSMSVFDNLPADAHSET
jgi:hypothetical protein